MRVHTHAHTKPEETQVASSVSVCVRAHVGLGFYAILVFPRFFCVL
jgi:hypothetical protein